jgi:hypothetical protein
VNHFGREQGGQRDSRGVGLIAGGREEYWETPSTLCEPFTQFSHRRSIDTSDVTSESTTASSSDCGMKEDIRFRPEGDPVGSLQLKSSFAKRLLPRLKGE